MGIPSCVSQCSGVEDAVPERCRRVDGDLAIQVAVIILDSGDGAGIAGAAGGVCGSGGLVDGVVDHIHVGRFGERAEIVLFAMHAAAGGDGAVPVDGGRHVVPGAGRRPLVFDAERLIVRGPGEERVAIGRGEVGTVDVEHGGAEGDAIDPHLFGHFASELLFVFVVAEDKELPGDERRGDAEAALFGDDFADVGADEIEVAALAVLGVGLGGGAIEGHDDFVQAGGDEAMDAGVCEREAEVGTHGADDAFGGGHCD